MKRKVWDELVSILILILLLPVILLFILYTPIDFIKFKTSRLCRDFKKENGKVLRYTWLCGMSHEVRVYELFSKNRLPLEMIPRDESDNTVYNIYFYENKTLFWVGDVPGYDKESGNWYLINEDDPVDFAFHSAMKKVTFTQQTGLECERIIYLADEREYSKEEKKHLSDEPSIVTYNKKNVVQKLRELGIE